MYSTSREAKKLKPINILLRFFIFIAFFFSTSIFFVINFYYFVTHMDYNMHTRTHLHMSRCMHCRHLARVFIEFQHNNGYPTTIPRSTTTTKTKLLIIIIAIVTSSIINTVSQAILRISIERCVELSSENVSLLKSYVSNIGFFLVTLLCVY